MCLTAGVFILAARAQCQQDKSGVAGDGGGGIAAQGGEERRYVDRAGKPWTGL